MRKLAGAAVFGAVAVMLVASPAVAKEREARASTTVPEGATFAEVTTSARGVAGATCRKYKSATSVRVLVTSGSASGALVFACSVVRGYRVPATTTSTTTTTTVPPTTATTQPPPPTVPVNPSCMSFAEFDQIQPGMSHDEITAIVGGPGTLSVSTNLAGYQGEIWQYTGCGGIGANASIQFQDGAMITKAQFGLR
jgi:hypothetical protein